MLTNQLFYRKYGIRLLQQLMHPPTFEMTSLELPMKSIYHYVTYDGVENGPASDDYLFRSIKKPILVGHIFDTVSQLGNPRKQAIATTGMVRDYHNQNRRMRPLRNIQLASKDPQSLIVYNYCFINKTYRYVRSYFTEYFKWYNTFSAVIANIATVSNESDNQHYLISGCPKLIPSLSQLNVASNSEISQSILKSINSSEAYLLLELWKWLGNNRASSLFSKIPNNKIHLVNIIYIESGKWCILNLGSLNSFRSIVEEGNNEGYVIESSVRVSPEQVSKRLLKMFMTIMELKTVTSNAQLIPEIKKVEVSILTGNEVVSEDEIQVDEDSDEINIEPVESASNSLTEDEVTLNSEEVQIVTNDDNELNETPEETIKRLLEEDEQIDKDLTLLNEISRKQENEVDATVTGIKEIIDEPELSLEDSIIGICDKLADDGLLTAGEYRRFVKLANSYKQIVSPDGMTPLNEFIIIKPEELKITESATMVDNSAILDKTMLKSSLIDFDSRYIKNILSRDTANVVMSVQRAGIAVTNYRVEKVKDILGGFEMHTLKLSPVEGLASTLRFKLPIVNSDGTYTSNGIKYRIRKQRGDLPIRKTSYNRVALTSYYGKSFINRGRKKSEDYGYWLQTTVMEKGLNKEDLDITNIAPADTFDKTLKAPRAYTALSMSFKTIDCRGYTLVFNRREVLKTYPDNVLKHFEKDGSIVIGSNNKGIYLVLDNNGALYTTDNLELKLFGLFEQFLGISVQNAPVEYVDLVVFGKEIPMGVILGYRIGFDKLMKILKVTPRRVNAGSRLNLESNEYALAFSDETLIFSRDDKLASVILAGFNEYHRAIKLFSVYSFDKKGVYLNLLDTANLGVRYLREIDLMYNMFIDNITKDLLIEMKEPVTFQGLLFRACEMLLDDQHPDELDPKYMRIKGYERLSGAVYTELVQAIRVHNGKLGKSNQPIEMNPYAVWKRISEDPSKSQVNEINPIKALKEAEAVTFAGTGGRNKRSMTAHTRAYHVNDMGTISESTVDSADVAINIFTSADPQFSSLRGISKSYDFETTGATALLSTSALLAPGSDRDDPKRVNFVAIQQEHSIACDGYRQASVRTGYEQIVAQRSTDLFAMTAKKLGFVKSINAFEITVQYDDNELVTYELGRRFGNAAGLIIPHSVITELKVGERLELGDTICYNEGFFEPDLFNKKRVVFKNSTNVKTVLWESHQTLDDSSALSSKAANKLMTKITKMKNILIRFDQSVSRLVKLGDQLESDNVLCLIEDSITSTNKLFDEQTLDTLKAVGAQAPRAHVKGVVERVEIFYNGEKEDMSESLLELLKLGNSSLRKLYVGKVDSGFRIDNNPLGLDCCVIRIYITTSVPAGVGDKTVFANQMKSVTGGILDQEYITEDGTEIDAIFGTQSISNRIVSSPFIIGTTTTLLKVIAQRAVKLYKQ